MKSYNLKFITPCFCAGADQLIAEVRASAIRGELRWWFRCMGGNQQEEQKVFGSLAGNGNASTVMVRVLSVIRGNELYQPAFISPNDSDAYLHYLLTAPDESEKSRLWETPPNPETKKKGVARASSQLPHGTTFQIVIFQKRSCGQELDQKLNAAIETMLRFGGIGYRRTRGFGAWIHEDSLLTRSETEVKLNDLKKFHFTFKLGQGGNADPLIVLRQVEAKLKGNKQANTGYRLKDKFPAVKKTPLGYSLGKNERQTSSVLFRPCPFRTKSGDIQFALLELQAPDSVLGTDTKKERIIV